MSGRFLAALAVALVISAAPKVSSAQGVLPTEAQAIAKDAYVYSYAMMENYQTLYSQAVDKTANGYVGGFNVYRHFSEPAKPENKDIVSPNNDTPYSWAWLDLRAEPIVISVPEVPKDRYHVIGCMPTSEIRRRQTEREGNMQERVGIVSPTDPDFKRLLESGRLVSGADIQPAWHAWNTGEIPALDADEGRNIGNRHA
ncbi:MAG: DUF1254 domain-containing protein [Xanthobacteraceae bacterium]|jgi:hypothetical protein